MSSRVTHQLMLICATRLDERVTAEEFVEQLDTLIEWCVEAGRNAQDDEPEQTGGLEPARPPAGQPGETIPAKKGGGGKLSDETREEIRYEADLAQDDEGKLPRGFVSGKAEEHGVSRQTIYNILAD